VSVGSMLMALILSSVLAAACFALTRGLDALNGSSAGNLQTAPVKADSPRHNG
jgi:hypothetical protein